MALSAHLQFGDNKSGRYTSDYLLVDCRCSFRRSFDDLRPNGRPYCDSVELQVVASGNNSLLYNWFTDKEEMCGRILFDLSSVTSDDANPTEEIQFENARCFSLQEHYDKDTRFRRLLKLAFEADEIIADDVAFNR